MNIAGSICIVHNQESNRTYCLCLGFRDVGQEQFQQWILKNVDCFRSPRSILIARFGLVIEALKGASNDSFVAIAGIANALSTGDYIPQMRGYSLPVPTG